MFVVKTSNTILFGVFYYLFLTNLKAFYQNITLSILFFFCISLYAQKPVFIDLKKQISLPDITFYDIIEDSKGFVWLASNKGLFKYDGQEFQKYDNENKKGLAVFDLNEDKEGKIWCTNISGQVYFTEKSDLVSFIDIGKELKFQLGKMILQEEHIYVFTPFKILKVDKKTKTISEIITSTEFIGQPFLFKNEIHFTVGNTLCKLINDTIDKFTKLPLTKKVEKSFLFSDDKNLFLSINPSEKNIYNFDNQKYKKIEFPKEIIGKLINKIVSHKNLFWFLTDDGTYIYQYKNNTFLFKNQFLKDVFCTDFLQDNHQNIWITTLEKGILLMPNQYIKNYELPLNSNPDFIRKINDKHLLTVSKNGRISVLNIDNGSIKDITNNELNDISFVSSKISENQFLLGNNTIIYKLKEDFTFNRIEDNSLFIGVKKIIKHTDNQFIVNNYSSAKLLNLEGNKPSLIKYLGKNRTNISFYDSLEKKTYIGFIDKLTRFDKKLNSKTVTIKNQQIFSTAIDKTTNGIIWVSTTKKGVLGIKNDGVVTHFSIKNGLLSDSIEQLKSDENSLWITNQFGVQKIDITTKKIKNITKTDGIPKNVKDIAVFDKKVILLTNDGLFSFDKKYAFKNATKPNIYIKKITVNNQNIEQQAYLDLAHNENKIDISIFSNGFCLDEKYKYFYSIYSNKNTKTWQQLPENSSTISLSNLASDLYYFSYKSLDISSGKFSDEKQFQINIQYPVWKHPITIVCYFLVGFLLLFLWYKRNEQRKNKNQVEKFNQLQNEKQLIALNLENLRSQMNPHFIFNALTAIQDYIEQNEKDLASEYLVKFSRLIRIYLEHSKTDLITIPEEIEALQLYLDLEKERFEEKIEIDLQVDKNLRNNKHKIPSVFVQPYVENAIKHGLLHKIDLGKLRISYQLEENNIICTILDNGIGRKKASEIVTKRPDYHKSFATSANQRRLDLLNKDKKQPIKVTIDDLVSSEKSLGTKVTITIPTNNK